MNIGVWNTAFLGDALLTLPLVRVLRRTWPQARVDFYVRAGLGPLFEPQEDVSQIFEVSRANRTAAGMLKLIRAISARRYDVWLGAHLSPRSSIVAMASGAPLRIGYKHAWHRELAYTHTVDRCFDSLDEIERLLRLLEPLSGMAHDQLLLSRPAGWSGEGELWPPPWPAIWPKFQLRPEARQAAAAFWKGLPGGPVLGLHPGSVWATKRWTGQGFAYVARKAVEAGATVMLFAGPGEGAMSSEVLSLGGLHGHPGVVDCSEKLSLPQLAAWLDRLDCYLTNDSGPMHLAWLQDVPVVSVFGPTVKELGFFPRGEAMVVETRASIACRPCGLHGPQECPQGHHACMATVDPEEVWQAVQGKLFAGRG